MLNGPIRRRGHEQRGLANAKFSTCDIDQVYSTLRQRLKMLSEAPPMSI